MLKKLIVFLTMAVICVASLKCSKSDDNSCTPVPPQNEEPAILAYIESASIPAVKDESGVYYQIIDPGSGASPTINSRIFIKYKGILLNGSQFDAQSDPLETGWALGSLITGWQIVLPKIKKGGKIKMIIPSSLAYGCTGVGNNSIPPNSILVFDVELVDFY